MNNYELIKRIADNFKMAKKGPLPLAERPIFAWSCNNPEFILTGCDECQQTIAAKIHINFQQKKLALEVQTLIKSIFVSKGYLHA